MQAAKEHAAVAAHLQQVLSGLGLPADTVPADELAQACRHACDMRMVRTRSLEEEYTQASSDEWAWMLELEGREYPHAFYVLIRAADRFRAVQGRWPGEEEASPGELARFKEVLGVVCAELGLPHSKIEEELIHEVVRYARRVPRGPPNWRVCMRRGGVV